MNIIKLFIVLNLLVLVKSQAFELKPMPDLGIPNVCKNLPNKLIAANLSGVCLSAQLLAASFPVYLPVANQLCQILEGVTAKVEVLQLKVNLVHNICDTALMELENTLSKGTNWYDDIGTNPRDLLEKLHGINSKESIEGKAYDDRSTYLNQKKSDWDDMFKEINGDPVGKYKPKKEYLKNVASSEFLSNEVLANNLVKAFLDRLVELLNTTITIKQSVDITNRLNAELAFQQIIHGQLLGEMLRLESAEGIKRANQDNWTHKFLKKR